MFLDPKRQLYKWKFSSIVPKILSWMPPCWLYSHRMSRITKRDLRADSALVVTNDKKILVWLKKFLLVAHIFINSSPSDRKRREIVRLSSRWGVARLPNKAQNSNFHGRPFSTLYKTWSVLEIQISFLKAETKIIWFSDHTSLNEPISSSS